MSDDRLAAVLCIEHDYVTTYEGPRNKPAADTDWRALAAAIRAALVSGDLTPEDLGMESALLPLMDELQRTQRGLRAEAEAMPQTALHVERCKALRSRANGIELAVIAVQQCGSLYRVRGES